jgi:hypothetical protein
MGTIVLLDRGVALAIWSTPAFCALSVPILAIIRNFGKHR